LRINYHLLRGRHISYTKDLCLICIFLGQGIRFESKLVPAYVRRAKSIDALLPWLYLRGISQADTGPAVQARALALAAIIARAIPMWLEDDAEMAATMARLDSDLSRMDGFGRKSPSR